MLGCSSWVSLFNLLPALTRPPKTENFPSGTCPLENRKVVFSGIFQLANYPRLKFPRPKRLCLKRGLGPVVCRDCRRISESSPWATLRDKHHVANWRCVAIVCMLWRSTALPHWPAHPATAPNYRFATEQYCTSSGGVDDHLSKASTALSPTLTTT